MADELDSTVIFSEQTVALLLDKMVDVLGRNSQPSTPFEASEMADIIDFLHHVVHYEEQGGPVQANSKQAQTRDPGSFWESS
ncbi:hypothetical protein HS088_TW05G00770 [Tripterygium wilfordii]|uniref:Uncharacterized protein n=1 Tax=Tripterygium wilfordii TaxID=458696 RepID=A0A7J7DNX5_TRIWF|nr:hypothetical protein HS088_TW05G00770 [Tripterygium wilfordii]